MRLRCGLLHHVSDLFGQLLSLFLVHIVLVFSWFSDFKHVFSVAVEPSLRRLVLHDASAKVVEVDDAGIAEPVVDDHCQVEAVFGVCLHVEIDGQLHGEVVLVELGAVFILSDAEMNSQGRKTAFRVNELSVEFHIVVASAEEIGPKHLRLGRIVEDTSLVVSFIQPEGETKRGVMSNWNFLPMKHLSLRNISVDIEDVFCQLSKGILSIALAQGVPVTVVAEQLNVRHETLYLGNEKPVSRLVLIAQSVGNQRLAVDFMADIEVDSCVLALFCAGRSHQRQHDV